MTDNVIPLRLDRSADVAALAAEIKAIVYAYSGRVTLADAIGALQVVAHEVLRENDA